MKKHPLLAMLAMICLLFITGCSDNGKSEITDEAIEEPKELFTIQNTENTVSLTESENGNEDEDGFGEYSIGYERVNPMRKYLGDLEEFPPPPVDIDVDFTILGAYEFDDVFSDVMFVSPENFLEKTIRIVGPYSKVLYDEEYGYFHLILVDDEAGCCQRFVEFSWDADNYPEEYPQEDAIIDIIGRFESGYMEEYEYTYYFLVVSHFSVFHGGA